MLALRDAVKPKKVIFEEKGLNPEVIQDLKRRAERNSQERQRRSASREPERSKVESLPIPARTIQPPVPEGLGTMVQLMDAKGAQEEVVRLVRDAKSSVILLGFTYDLPEFQEVLVDAASRLVDVKVGLDHRTTLSTRPRDQQQFAQQLQANRIPVTLLKGGPLGPEYKKVGRVVNGTGIQHAKTVLADGMLVVGSCNWTVSSKANSEVAVLIRLSNSGERLVRDTLEGRLAGGERLEAALERPRRRSTSRHTETDD